MIEKIILFFCLCSILLSCNNDSTVENPIRDSALNVYSDAMVTYSIKLKKSEFVSINTDSVESLFQNKLSSNIDSALLIAHQYENLIKESIKLDSIGKAKLKKEAEAKLKKLKKKFLFKKDEFQDVGFYYHKTWGMYWPNRKTLTVGLNSSGYYYLKSNYSSSDWLFHKNIKVKVGDEKFETGVVPRYDDNNRTDHSGGRVWEVITYDDGAKIIKAISKDIGKKVTVRFVGDKFYDDATLSKNDKKAIKEAYELAQAIKLTK